MGVHAAFAKARDRITGAFMYPGEWTNGRFEQTDFEQTGYDATSALGRPIPDSTPLTERPDESWVGTSWDLRWGQAIVPHYEGIPITFYPPQVVNPRVHDGYGPFVQYPPIARGNPVPYGDTVPVLGE